MADATHADHCDECGKRLSTVHVIGDESGTFKKLCEPCMLAKYAPDAFTVVHPDLTLTDNCPTCGQRTDAARELAKLKARRCDGCGRGRPVFTSAGWRIVCRADDRLKPDDWYCKGYESKDTETPT